MVRLINHNHPERKSIVQSHDIEWVDMLGQDIRFMISRRELERVLDSVPMLGESFSVVKDSVLKYIKKIHPNYGLTTAFVDSEVVGLQGDGIAIYFWLLRT